MTTTTLQLTDLQPLTWSWRGFQIRYSVLGMGKPLVLIHGFGASIGHWRKNMPALAAAGYRVYAIDLLGFGASEKPAIEYSLELWQDLLRDFWQAYIQEPTVWVGNSIGALLSLMLTVNAPEMTQGAALLNCAGGLNHRPEELALPLRAVMGTFATVVNSPFGFLLFQMVKQKSQIRRTLYQVYGNREAVTDELVDLLYEPACDTGAHKVFAAILRAPAGPSPTELLPRLERPLLVLWGADDPWTPIDAGQVFQDLSGTQNPHTNSAYDITFTSIPETGHCPHDERPEITNDYLLQWLGKHHGSS